MGLAEEALTWQSLFEATGMLVGFCAFLFVGSAVVPGRQIQGVQLKSGEQKTYRLNGLRLFLCTLFLAGAGQGLGWFSLSSLTTHFFSLFVVTNIFAFLMTGILAIQGRRKVESLESHGAGAVGLMKDIFFGSELNPTWLGVDLKMFSYRPSLIGLALMNLSFAALQYETHGALSPAMLLYQAFTLIYVFNYFQFEYGMVFTWDIIAENFGWMLVWGDYVFVPFFYCISGWFLLGRLDPLPLPALVGLPCLFVFGFWLFRGANQQKHRFKMDPAATIWGKPAETVGGRLLVSGFWGIGRHLNYTGEICVYLAFTMTTGFDSIIPYCLPAWLISLLLHRAWRDDKRCREKYGKLWSEYTQHARFRMVPFVY